MVTEVRLYKYYLIGLVLGGALATSLLLPYIVYTIGIGMYVSILIGMLVGIPTLWVHSQAHRAERGDMERMARQLAERAVLIKVLEHMGAELVLRNKEAEGEE
jgi:F0F1-type ATP synthase assembly protein I